MFNISISNAKANRVLMRQIFQLATAPFEDLSRAYDQDDDAWRPDHRGPLTSSTGLLLTCRLAWLEANALPMQQAVHLFWQNARNRAAKKDMIPGRWWHGFGSHLTKLNLDNLRSVHFMFSLHKLDHLFYEKNRIADVLRYLKPDVFKITNRFDDWPSLAYPYSYCWARHDIALGKLLEACQGRVKEFRLELEFIDQCLNQLAGLVKHLLCMQSPAEEIKDAKSGKLMQRRLEVTKAPLARQWLTTTTRLIAGEQHPGERKSHLIHVRELEWIHVDRYADQQDVLQGEHPGDARTRKIRSAHSGPDRALARKGKRHMYDGVLNYEAWRQDHNRQHSQELAKAVEGHRRRLFADMMMAQDTRIRVQRWETQGSLLRFE